MELQVSEADLKQITRLRYYALKLFKTYLDQSLPTSDITYDEICAFGGRFDTFFQHASNIICYTLAQSYREILKRQEGTAFSLPRDAKVWDLVQEKFNGNLALLRLNAKPTGKSASSAGRAA